MGFSAPSRTPGRPKSSASALTTITLVGAVVVVILDGILAHDTFYHCLKSQGPALCIAAVVVFSTLFGPMYAARLYHEGRRGVAIALLAGVASVVVFVAVVRAVFGVGGAVETSSSLGALMGDDAAAEQDNTANLLVAVGMGVMMAFTAGLAFVVELHALTEKLNAERTELRDELLEIRSELAARANPANAELFDASASADAVEKEYQAKRKQIDAIYDSAELLATTMLVGKMDQANADEVVDHTLGLAG